MSHPLASPSLASQSLVDRRLGRGHRLRQDERGQATAEYALVLLAAAALAGLLLAWASSTDGVDRLMNAVLDQILGDVTA